MKRILASVLIATLAGVAAMPGAHASTAYAYWSYWQADGVTWKYARVGPALAPALDGTVDGWRFTVSTEDRAQAPSLAPDFHAVCGATTKVAGKARIALVIEYGKDGPAPRTACAVVDEGLSRMSALGSVAALRLHDGFICAIDEYPRTGCGEVATRSGSAGAAPTSGANGQGGRSPVSTILTMVLAVVAVAMALRSARIQRGERG